MDGKLQKEAPYMIRRSFEHLKVQSVSEIPSALPFPPADIEELADLEPGTLSGHVEARPEPVLKEEFRRDGGNVVTLFNRKLN